MQGKYNDTSKTTTYVVILSSVYFKHKNSFFSGNKYLHMLTSQRSYSLRVDLENYFGESRYADYSIFNIQNGVNKYKLTVGGYSGNAGKLSFVIQVQVQV